MSSPSASLSKKSLNFNSIPWKHNWKLFFKLHFKSLTYLYLYLMYLYIVFNNEYIFIDPAFLRLHHFKDYSVFDLQRFLYVMFFIIYSVFINPVILYFILFSLFIDLFYFYYIYFYFSCGFKFTAFFSYMV